MFEIQQLDHVVLRVRDRDRMIRFYTEALGCTVARTSDDAGITMMRAGQSMIDLVASEGKLGLMKGTPPGEGGHNMDHFCLRVEPFDEEMIRKHLSQFGVSPSPVATRLGAEGEGPSMYLDDPEGNTIELKGPPSS